MLSKINRVLDSLSEYFAHRKGLLPVIGILFVVINGLLQIFPGTGFIVESNLFLHFQVEIR